MQVPEIELKFPVIDPVAFQASLPVFGFHLETPRTFEQNTVYDTPDRSLRARHHLLRLRQYGPAWTVTHKRLPDPGYPAGERYKVRVETETRVTDGAAMVEIFTQLGYAPVFRYEKFRTEWTCSAGEPTGHLVVDETPIGTYAELEGPTEWIDRMLAELGIDPEVCLTYSYGKLFLDWKERTGSPAEHLTFSAIDAHELMAK